MVLGYRSAKKVKRDSNTLVIPTTISSKGIDLIKHFEGLRLQSYYCSSHVLTIGYGSTGSHVKEGMRITEAEAEQLLISDLSRFENAVSELIKHRQWKAQKLFPKVYGDKTQMEVSGGDKAIEIKWESDKD